jgi:hypothetical protein
MSSSFRGNPARKSREDVIREKFGRTCHLEYNVVNSLKLNPANKEMRQEKAIGIGESENLEKGSVGYSCSMPKCSWTFPKDRHFFEALREFGKHFNEKHPNEPWGAAFLVRPKS